MKIDERWERSLLYATKKYVSGGSASSGRGGGGRSGVREVPVTRVGVRYLDLIYSSVVAKNHRMK